MHLKVTGTFQVCKAYALGKAKKARVNKLVLTHLKIKGKCLFFDISSLSIHSFGGEILTVSLKR